MDWMANNYPNMDFPLEYDTFIKNAINKLHSGNKGASNYGFGLDGMDNLEDGLTNDIFPTYHHNATHQRNMMSSGSAAMHHNSHPLMVPSSYMPNSMSRSLSSRRYPCKMCTSIFDSKTEYQMHFQSHMREPKPYKCSQCPKCFANSSYLSQHMRIHLGIKPYHCELCKKKFTQLSHLQQHLRTHTGDKPYKCPASGCTKAFSQLSNLQSHSRCHQTDKPFKCNSCYKCFYDESSLLDHIPKHKDSKHLKTHICKFCGKSYTQETYLARHMAKHLDKMEKIPRHHHHHHDTLVKTNGDYFPGKQESPSDTSSSRGLMQEDLMSSGFPGVVPYNGYSSPYNAHMNGYSNGSPGYEMMPNGKSASSAFCMPNGRTPFAGYGVGYDGFNMRNYTQQNGCGGGGGGESKSGSMSNHHFTYEQIHNGRGPFAGLTSGMPTMVENRGGPLKDTTKQPRY